MSSRFISAGSIDASKGRSPPNFHTQPPSIFHSEARQKEREEAAHQLEQSRQQSSRSGIGASAEAEPQRSLYEVLQANKAAKQAALEEARRLRNQFRALDNDEVEFLEGIRAREREESERVRNEVERGLEKFREERRKSSGIVGAAGAGNEVLAEEFVFQRKRKAAREGGGKKRARVLLVKKVDKDNEEKEGNESKDQDKNTAKGNKPTAEDTPGPGEKVKPVSRGLATEKTEVVEQTSKATAPFGTKLAGLLVDYGSDDDE
jgi:N-terminal domain of NEFA-interacting nuclear protein NIP30.